MRLRLLIAILPLSASVLGATCDEESERWSPALEVASRILNASIEAERQARGDFQTQLEQGSLSQAEVDDYRFYLEDLERLVQTNGQAVERLRCMTAEASPQPQSAEASGLFQTQKDAGGELDAELSASLSQFDELLLRETEAARNSARSTSWGAQSGAAGASGQETGAGASGQSTQSSANASGAETAGRTANETSSERVASARGAAGTSAGTIPEDIPDGSDDDVVARQLREAAENEADPVLREKLWAEYRKYKSEQF